MRRCIETLAAGQLLGVKTAGRQRAGARPLYGGVLPFLVFLVVLALWEIIPSLFAVPDFIFPRLSQVVGQFSSRLIPIYALHTLVTLAEAGLGLLVGALVGLLLGVFIAEIPLLERMCYPYVIALQSMPKVAFAPLFLIWFGFGLSSKVLMVALLTCFPVMVNTISGILSVDSDRLDLLRCLGASRWQMRWKVVFPSALPQILSGFEIAVAFSLVGAIVSEFVTARNGLGVLIQQMQFQMNTAGVFAALVILAVLGVVFNHLVRLLRRKVLFWMPGERGRS